MIVADLIILLVVVGAVTSLISARIAHNRRALVASVPPGAERVAVLEEKVRCLESQAPPPAYDDLLATLLALTEAVHTQAEAVNRQALILTAFQQEMTSQTEQLRLLVLAHGPQGSLVINVGPVSEQAP